MLISATSILTISSFCKIDILGWPVFLSHIPLLLFFWALFIFYYFILCEWLGHTFDVLFLHNHVDSLHHKLWFNSHIHCAICTQKISSCAQSLLVMLYSVMSCELIRLLKLLFVAGVRANTRLQAVNLTNMTLDCAIQRKPTKTQVQTPHRKGQI